MGPESTELKWALKGPKQKLYHYYHHFGGHWQNDNKTVWAIYRAFTGSIAFIYPQWKYTIYQTKLTIKYKFLLFEFSNTVKEISESKVW